MCTFFIYFLHQEPEVDADGGFDPQDQAEAYA